VNSRNRFLATMALEPVDRAPLWEYGYWAETVRRWYREGLPKEVGLPEHPDLVSVAGEGSPWDDTNLPGTARDKDVAQAMGFDPGLRRLPLTMLAYPPFETRILKEYDDIIIWQDSKGVIRRDKKDHSSISELIDGPIKTRENWERYKSERLRPSLEGRLPTDWAEQRERLRQRDFPLAIGSFGGQFGFFHTLRYLLGPTDLLYKLHDDAELVQGMMNDLTDFWCALCDQVLSQVPADFAFYNEDMAFKNGPFISPAMFRRFLLPCYQKLNAVLRSHGTRVIFVDSDGDNWKLIPLFLEGGVTGLFPLEAAAHMDAWKLRQAFPRLQMMGGVDKRAVAAGKATIDQVLEATIRPALASGGYVPMIDHLAPPDISWDNFCYYRLRLREMTFSPLEK